MDIVVQSDFKGVLCSDFPDQSSIVNSVDEIIIPLIVDLDGTLISTDLLQESAVAYLYDKPIDIFSLFAQLRIGKASLKSWLATRYRVVPERLPYRQCVIELIEAVHAGGRPIFLATASHQRWADVVSEHVGLFSGVIATDGTTNLAGAAKAAALVARFGEGGFDYVGNSAADLDVWQAARQCYAVAAPARVERRLSRSRPDCQILPSPKLDMPVWLRALRVHQYAKNVLIFLPAIAGHVVDPRTILNAIIAFVSFSLAASAIYLVNDLVDIADDRSHPTKCNRPLAAGLLPIPHALVAAGLLVAISSALAVFLPYRFALVLFGYLVMTTAYSFWLKRKVLVDVVLLALLYSMRVLAGSAATGIELSNWLLGLCVFTFSSLALVKRYSELLMRQDKGLPDAGNRGYLREDLPIVAALAAATGVNSVTILGLYISSPQVLLMYRHPKALWLLCPLLLFMMARALLVAHRREMNDDPILWVLKDKASRVALIINACVFLAGIV